METRSVTSADDLTLEVNTSPDDPPGRFAITVGGVEYAAIEADGSGSGRLAIDANITSPAVGHLLQWDGTEWVNEPGGSQTAGGPPSRGTYEAGRTFTDPFGGIWVCVVGGTPGTWTTPSANVQRINPVMTARPGDWRPLPGIFQSNGLMTANRLYGMAYPIPLGLTIAQIVVDLTVAGSTGATIRCGVRTDEFGWPADLIEDLGALAADGSTGRLTWTLSTPIVGGRTVWIELVAQGGATTQPTTSRISYSPFGPIFNDGSGDASNTQFVFTDSVSAALPAVYSDRAHASAHGTGTAPFVSVQFGAAPPEAPYLPDRSPVLAPDQSYEEGWIQEPSVYWDGSEWHMIYSGGVTHEAICWATAPSIDGSWTKHGVILGGAGSVGGVSGAIGRSSIFYEGGTLYIYWAGGDLKVVSGPNPGSLGVPATAMSASQGTVTSIQNSSVINDGGGVYKMLFESKVSGAGVFKTGSAHASSPLGPFTLDTFPLTSLAVSTGMYGGPCVFKLGANSYANWYHASDQATQQLPTQIYRATSTDFATWVPNLIPKIRRHHPYEVDQCADVFLVTDPATEIIYAFWSANNNSTSTGYIMRSIPQAMPLTV